MNNDWFFEKFALIADAPGAVAKMRGLILQLAVHGKLVPQDPSDEPAEKLCEPDEELSSGSPSEVPLGWILARLEQLAEINGGFAFKSTDYTEEGARVVRISDFDEFGFKDHKVVRHSFSAEFHKFILEEQNILMAMTGGTVGKSYFVRFMPEVMVVNQRVATIKVLDSAMPRYIDIVIRSEMTQEVIRRAKNSTNDNISMGDIKGFTIPLPPLAEQKRIVAKVDELMGLCDALEAQQQERELRKSVLVRSSLSRFAESPTPENLGYLFHRSYDIPPSELRKSILTLAVQGKLVPQDPNDEPAMTLLQQIESDKSLMVKEGKLRGSTTITPMEAQEGEFELPSSWTWVPFGQIMVNRDGERIPVSKEERESKAKTYDYYGASGIIDKIDNYLFDKPLLLIGEDGANLINRSTPIAFIARGKYWVNNHAHVLDGISEDFLRYIELHINAINLERYITGSAQPKMNQAKMNSIPIALPPLAEQRRIVAKVDQLMALVDELERQQQASRENASKLLDAIVQEMTSGGQGIAATLES
jgi:type I restriction enzyme S subunit